jgi:hypothetical protein
MTRGPIASWAMTATGTNANSSAWPDRIAGKKALVGRPTCTAERWQPNHALPY